MNIEEFCSVHSVDREIEHIDSFISNWALQAQVDEFLAMPVMEGVLIGDWLSGKRIADIDFTELDQNIPVAAKDGFAHLMQEKANSVDEIRDLIIRKFRGSEKSLIGLIKKFRGRSARISLWQRREEWHA
jgi:hypothetical protein